MIIHTDPRANITANAYSRSKVALHSEYKLYQFKKETVTPHQIVTKSWTISYRNALVFVDTNTVRYQKKSEHHQWQ